MVLERNDRTVPSVNTVYVSPDAVELMEYCANLHNRRYRVKVWKYGDMTVWKYASMGYGSMGYGHVCMWCPNARVSTNICRYWSFWHSSLSFHLCSVIISRSSLRMANGEEYC